MRPIPPLPKAFLEIPISHRGLHNISDNIPENSRAAFQASIDAGFGIELDLQLSKDGQAMVFHDYDMRRLTDEVGPIQLRNSADLATCKLLHGKDETIPSFASILELVGGRVPLLVELKDQDGGMGANIGILEKSIAQSVEKYSGPIAFMSFNPHSVQELSKLLPNHPRGLTTCSLDDKDSLLIPSALRRELAAITRFEETGSSFISHNRRSLTTPRVTELKQSGVPILCWTVTSTAEEFQARQVADNVTFEGYMPS